jgi:hAT family C-terminal dimerisation region
MGGWPSSRGGYCISVTVQATANATIHETWVKYEEMFDRLDEVRRTFNQMTIRPDWLTELQTGIEKMWEKLRKYYKATDTRFAFAEATLLHPALKTSFMKRAKYDPDQIEEFTRDVESRFIVDYDQSGRPPSPVAHTQSHGKRRRPLWSDSDSSDDEVNDHEFNIYLRDKTIEDPLKWWSKSQSMYPKLSKIARDIFVIPVTGAGVEQEFSICGRMVTKH